MSGRGSVQVRVDRCVRRPVECDLVWLKEVLAALLQDQDQPNWVVNLILTDDRSIRDLNRKYRDTDAVTNVLSFDLKDVFATPGEVTGEVYVSVDRARAESETFHMAFDETLARLAIHGMLHLTGWEDGTDLEDVAMEGEADRYLNTFLGRDDLRHQPVR